MLHCRVFTRVPGLASDIPLLGQSKMPLDTANCSRGAKSHPLRAPVLTNSSRFLASTPNHASPWYFYEWQCYTPCCLRQHLGGLLDSSPTHFHIYLVSKASSCCIFGLTHVCNPTACSSGPRHDLPSGLLPQLLIRDRSSRPSLYVIHAMARPLFLKLRWAEFYRWSPRFPDYSTRN